MKSLLGWLVARLGQAGHGGPKRFARPAKRKRGPVARCRARGGARMRGGLTTYHGTPDIANVRGILAQGWAVGTGNAAGDGVYTTTDISVARSYAGPSGYILELRVRGRVATWGGGLQAEFQKWCPRQRCAPDMSARSVFLLQRGYRLLRAGSTLVVLARAYRNFMACKVRLPAVHIVRVVSVATGKPVALGAAGSGGGRRGG